MKETVLQKKRELKRNWTRLKDLGNNEDLTFDQFYKIREIEDKEYKKWKFYEGYVKADEKMKKKK